ncbi:F-box/kelch-repeat protein At3g23880-like [Syzygium oleosum]|uniref:F-box/kelch-repeat protein At3g23880-like n=1 Tax=Syzygium oleosum TaxID=219896 RepID=UPI0011D20561|nr:F-box/kelch-repeat protein At3g23880-like [Syzygium oleosum]
MSSLPLDLHHNVLSRLPAISLLKLRSVCRKWRDMIDDLHFAAMHATSSVESPRILLLPDPRHDADSQFAVNDEFLVTSLSRLAERTLLHVTGASCHGLVCVQDFRNGATHLFNPLTREIASLSSVDPSREPRGCCVIGIGVDHLTSRYKIVRMRYFIDRFRAEVLDQGSRSWRDIASAPPALMFIRPVFAAGSIHWKTTPRGVVRISSFDVAKEEFAWTPCPELQNAHLVDLRGALGLVHCSHGESVDVWVMKESGRSMKEYSVRVSQPLPPTNHFFFKVLSCRGRKIALSFYGRCWLYDAATDELKDVRRPGAAPAILVGSITVSLLSPAKLWNSGVAEIKET